MPESRDTRPFWEPEPITQLFSELRNLRGELGRLREELERLREEIKELRNESVDSFVRHEDFRPVRNLVYGLVAVIMLAVITAIVGLVVRRP
jgi:hypothetical protein